MPAPHRRPGKVRWRFVAKTLLACLALSAVTYIAIAAGVQRRLLFPRPSLEDVPPRPLDARQVWLRTASGASEAWYLPPARSERASSIIVFFHGNGELIDFLPREFSEPRAWGLGVLLVELPGYGRSAGEPSQQSIGAVAVAAGDWALGELATESPRIVAYGRSLGGAAAAILAAQRPTSALVLESTFTSVRSFAHRFWLPERLVRDPFDTLTLLESYPNPLLVLHGERDTLVPVSHAERLAAGARDADLYRLKCGHNDCVRPWPTIRRFLIRAGALPQGA